MSLFNKFTNYIASKNLFQKKDILLLAVSGGVDSIVLCELCLRAGFTFQIAHCNFQLRGAESDRDEAFVKSLGEKYNTKAFIKKFDTKAYAEDNKISIQVAARELRYNWFDELLAQNNVLQLEIDEVDEITTSNVARAQFQRPSFLLTAHHANDSIETLLMNFFKGTGIKGLHGILPKQGKIIRPLLFAKKNELLSFAMENNLPFLEDSSNSSDKYTRNYFRNQLIPSLEKIYPSVDENLLDNLERFNEIEMLYCQAIGAHKKKLLEYKGVEVHIPVLKLLKAEPLNTIVYEIIKEYNFTSKQVVDVLHLLSAESGKYITSATHKIIRNRKWIIISPSFNASSTTFIIDENDRDIHFDNGKLKIEKQAFEGSRIPDDLLTAMIDAKTITFPLLLRRWKQGDYFYPLGMQKKKKLGKFFNDLKISIADKEKIWVLENDKRIIWVVGKRIDDRFKITNQTKNILKIQVTEQ
jgi:tRNA(Ile)-lysidine synthase